MNFIDEETYKIQVDLYNTYLENLKNLVPNIEIKEKIIENIDTYPLAIRDDILFNLGGVLNHERYFKSISTDKTNPTETLSEKIKKDFGSISSLEKEIMEKSLYLKGSGYVKLVLDNNKNLKVITTSNEDLPEYYGFKTLMTIDLWEHAYFLKYKLNKYDYIKELLEHINYSYISKIYEEKI